jgi:hypothetical protein
MKSTSHEPSTDVRADLLIGGASLRRALMAGSQRVIRDRDELNRINVFPVPDGDTGTNLAFTFAAVLSGLRGLRRAGVDEVLRCAADEALDGARGNSGAIVAQFFQGLAHALSGRSRIALRELGQAFHVAAQSARLALAEPREGTILSVISAFAVGLRQRLSRGMVGLHELFGAGVHAAREALANTPRQLKVLAQAGVVDAGGRGFLDFLEGVEQFIEHGRSVLVDDDLPLAETLQMHPEWVHSDCEIVFQYCSECLLEGAELDADAVRQALSSLALDSLVLAGSERRMRVHAHTDAPALLFEAAAQFGTVSGRKADDMRAQTRTRGLRQPVVVVCDSAADLPAEAIERLHIHVVPVRVHFGQEEFLDRITLEHGALYRRLRERGESVRTSQPPPGDFRRAFEMLDSQGRQVLCLNISSKLSGTWQAADSAARRVQRGAVAFDTLHAACGEGLLVLRAAEAAAAGCSMAQIIELLRADLANTHTYALIRDLQFGVRGGRLPAVLLKLSRWMRFSVAIRRAEDGRIRPWKLLFWQRNLVGRFVAKVVKRFAHDVRYRLMVGHCDAASDAAQVAELLKVHPQVAQIDVVQTGTAIGVHAGPGSVVIGFMPVRDLPAPASSSLSSS